MHSLSSIFFFVSLLSSLTTLLLHHFSVAAPVTKIRGTDFWC
ncbi:hypothetical protein GLYMA_05G119351v4 [Glycine max]|nr:hypothetical protein GLYMA_05G119351v4 [Glycine max]KAH1133966.1 hypothetical protein GYH30_012389 [Glycine max]